MFAVIGNEYDRGLKLSEALKWIVELATLAAGIDTSVGMKDIDTLLRLILESLFPVRKALESRWVLLFIVNLISFCSFGLKVIELGVAEIVNSGGGIIAQLVVSI